MWVAVYDANGGTDEPPQAVRSSAPSPRCGSCCRDRPPRARPPRHPRLPPAPATRAWSHAHHHRVVCGVPGGLYRNRCSPRAVTGVLPRRSSRRTELWGDIEILLRDPHRPARRALRSGDLVVQIWSGCDEQIGMAWQRANLLVVTCQQERGSQTSRTAGWDSMLKARAPQGLSIGHQASDRSPAALLGVVQRGCIIATPYAEECHVSPPISEAGRRRERRRRPRRARGGAAGGRAEPHRGPHRRSPDPHQRRRQRVRRLRQGKRQARHDHRAAHAPRSGRRRFSPSMAWPITWSRCAGRSAGRSCSISPSPS